MTLREILYSMGQVQFVINGIHLNGATGSSQSPRIDNFTYFRKMKKFILPSAIIGVILFFWQFISFAGANLHKNAQQFTNKQDSIMQFMNQLNLPEGKYMIPMAQDNATPEQQQKVHEANNGKPWMSFSYYKKMDDGMVQPMVRGLLSDIIAGLLLIFILTAMGASTLVKSITHCIALGIFAFIFIVYTNHIWYPTFDLWAYILDAIAPYAIIGFLNAKYWNKIA